MKDEKIARKLLVNGVVQAVGFRPFIYRTAANNGLDGWVKNLGDAGVEILLQGRRVDVQSFQNDLQEKTPPLAEIDSVETRKVDPDPDIDKFKIKSSTSGSSGSGTIPPDIATCDECLDDVFGDTRYKGYWATSCVNCGPRFSVIRELPYDRDKTSMVDFPMCDACHQEYTDPGDRRYHAQTIACPECGPKLWYEASDERGRITEDPILSAVTDLSKKKIIAVKGLGGTHIACDATSDVAVNELRERLGRPEQPFALMSTEQSLKNGMAVSADEWETLRSPRRPIVLLNDDGGEWVSDSVAPGLQNIGVMLPYTALHHLIFTEFDHPLVMTSANMPGDPMLIENARIRKELTEVVDGYLLHNRKIVSRIDDSVVRHSGGNRKFGRRSRGWVPSAIEIDLGDRSMLALGAEQDNVIGLYQDGKVYLSQYLGDITGPDDLNFLEEAMERIFKLTNARLPEAVIHDLHPDFLTTELAKEIGTKTVAVQHHKAHVGSLLSEANETELVGIVLDGIGYGEDGEIWGGEIFFQVDDQLAREGSLSTAYMPGGDLATRHPGRMVAGILYPKYGSQNIDELEDTLRELGVTFPCGEQELEATLLQLSKQINLQRTSSTGRFLDAVSALLGVCHRRTYEGEPAMKLEAAGQTGKPHKFELSVVEKNGLIQLDQSELLLELINLSNHISTEDLAATAEWAIAAGTSKIAMKICDRKGVQTIGLSGGVAINDRISSTVRSYVQKAGYEYLTNTKVPVGDGGVALGQLWVGGRLNP